MWDAGPDREIHAAWARRRGRGGAGREHRRDRLVARDVTPQQAELMAAAQVLLKVYIDAHPELGEAISVNKTLTGSGPRFTFHDDERGRYIVRDAVGVDVLVVDFRSWRPVREAS